jgi:hypothetical protein
MRLDALRLRSAAKLLDLRVKVLLIAAATNRTYASRVSSLREMTPANKRPITPEDHFLHNVQKAIRAGRTPQESLVNVGDYLLTGP